MCVGSISFVQINYNYHPTCKTSISLKHPLDVGFAALKRVQVADEDSRAHGLRVLRVCLIANFAHFHWSGTAFCNKKYSILNNNY